MIERKNLNAYAVTRGGPITVRRPEDADLSWSDFRVYVLGENEWFDPQTSRQMDRVSHKYSESCPSPHAMYGPGIIVVSYVGGTMRTVENHVNDPRVWAWVRRSIAEGHLSAATLDATLCNNECDVEVAGD